MVSSGSGWGGSSGSGGSSAAIIKFPVSNPNDYQTLTFMIGGVVIVVLKVPE